MLNFTMVSSITPKKKTGKSTTQSTLHKVSSALKNKRSTTASIRASSSRAISSRASGPSVATSSVALSRRASVSDSDDDSQSNVGRILDPSDDAIMRGVGDDGDEVDGDGLMDVDADIDEEEDDDEAMEIGECRSWILQALIIRFN